MDEANPVLQNPPGIPDEYPAVVYYNVAADLCEATAVSGVWVSLV